MRKDVYAGIVTFNPDLVRLRQNLQSIHTQVEVVIVFDNGSDNFEQVRDTLSNFTNIKLICSDTNIGIAAALNKLMQYAYDNSVAWVLLLDQDSICQPGHVTGLSEYSDLQPGVKIIAPTIRDLELGVVGHSATNEYQFVRTCITSGALYNVNAWDSVGRFDESMFIDSVDFEYCFRIRKAGYKILLTSQVVLTHRIGKGKKHRFLLWHVNVFGHSAFRKYYIARNNVYYPAKHKLWARFCRGNIRNAYLLLTVACYEKDKSKKFDAILNGWREGLFAGFQKRRNTK
ncbi:glycosyltransferase family 2 protein [Lactiplantibacillus plantarum]|uniref:glycosyltransferase family 2 protein n=1 Tax=Lactiplantibacillus plantarum TaxID=1590 RepID=UPI003CEA4AE5